MNFKTVLFIVILVLILVLGFLCYFFFKKYRKWKVEYNQLLINYQGLSDEFQKLVEIEKIKYKNKEEANEKINELHTGDALANAIAGLSNNKG